jgi:cell division protein FtsL
MPNPYGQTRARERARAATAAQRSIGVSLFALFGALFIAVLLVFVMLAHIYYSEAARETVRLSAQLNRLSEQQRVLEISFESVIDMKEVERYARDVLGMSKPDPDQIAIVQSIAPDRAEVIESNEEGVLHGFGAFISSLVDYLR